MAPVNELVGVWSAAEGYLGHASDERLIFKPDGTGRVEFLNWGFCSADFFRWRVVSSGVLDLIGYRCLQRGGEDYESVVEAESTFHFTGVPFSISEAERPPGTGQRMLVLRINLPVPYPSELGL